MKAVILAGGAGSRLKEVVSGIPKPMAEVAGKPFLEYLILTLRKYEITEIILSVGYKGDIIEEYFKTGSRFGLKISYSYEDEPLGTAGGLKKAVNLIEEESVLVLNGDSFLDADYRELMDFYRENNANAVLALTYMKDLSRYGSVDIDENMEIVNFCEKKAGGSGLINSGVYVLNHRVLSGIGNGYVSLEKEVFPQMIGKRLFGFEVKGFFVDIGIPKDYLELNRDPQGIIRSLGLDRV